MAAAAPERLQEISAPDVFNEAKPETTFQSLLVSLDKVDAAAAPLFAWKLWIIASMWALKQRLMNSNIDTTRLLSVEDAKLVALAKRPTGKAWFDHLAARSYTTDVVKNVAETLRKYRPMACTAVQFVLDLNDSEYNELDFGNNERLQAFIAGCNQNQLRVREQFLAFHAKHKKKSTPKPKKNSSPTSTLPPLDHRDRRIKPKHDAWQAGDACFSRCFGTFKPLLNTLLICPVN